MQSIQASIGFVVVVGRTENRQLGSVSTSLSICVGVALIRLKSLRKRVLWEGPFTKWDVLRSVEPLSVSPCVLLLSLRITSAEYLATTATSQVK